MYNRQSLSPPFSVSSFEFELDDTVTTNGVSITTAPFHRYADPGVTITPSATSGNSVTLTASANLFTSDHVGVYFEIGTTPKQVKITAFTSATDITLFNLTSDLRNSGTILVVDYDKTKNNKIIHNEWALIKENVADNTLPANFKTKFIDSLVGADSFGNSVPDNTLNIAEQYGIQFRPRQSLFVKRFDALKTFLTTVNSIMAKNTIALTRDITDLLAKDPEPVSYTHLRAHET